MAEGAKQDDPNMDPETKAAVGKTDRQTDRHREIERKRERGRGPNCLSVCFVISVNR